jgi:hypothetical protein
MTGSANDQNKLLEKLFNQINNIPTEFKDYYLDLLKDYEYYFIRNNTKEINPSFCLSYVEGLINFL